MGAHNWHSTVHASSASGYCNKNQSLCVLRRTLVMWAHVTASLLLTAVWTPNAILNYLNTAFSFVCYDRRGVVERVSGAMRVTTWENAVEHWSVSRCDHDPSVSAVVLSGHSPRPRSEMNTRSPDTIRWDQIQSQWQMTLQMIPCVTSVRKPNWTSKDTPELREIPSVWRPEHGLKLVNSPRRERREARPQWRLRQRHVTRKWGSDSMPSQGPGQTETLNAMAVRGPHKRW